MAGLPIRTARNLLQKNLCRPVSFTEATITKSRSQSNTHVVPYTIDVETNDNVIPINHRFGSICNSCRAWTSITIGILILVIILIGGGSFAFLQSKLSQVRLYKLDITKINIDNMNTDTLLTTDLEVRLNITNNDERMKVSYSSITARIHSQGINLRSLNLPALVQNPKVSSDLRVHVAVNRMSVEEDKGQNLVDTSKAHLMLIDVEVKGYVEFSISRHNNQTKISIGHKMHQFPFIFSCYKIDQSEIDDGHAPKCSSRLVPSL